MARVKLPANVFDHEVRESEKMKEKLSESENEPTQEKDPNDEKRKRKEERTQEEEEQKEGGGGRRRNLRSKE